eukprot:UN05117
MLVLMSFHSLPLQCLQQIFYNKVIVLWGLFMIKNYYKGILNNFMMLVRQHYPSYRVKVKFMQQLSSMTAFNQAYADRQRRK